MLEQVSRVGLLGVAVALVGSIIYVAWDRLFGDYRPAIQAQDEENTKQVLVVGLDGAGKTSVLHSLSTNTVKRSHGPTAMFNSVCVKTEDAEIEFLEVGGSKSLRKCWSTYLPGSQALVYVVDSADRNQLPLAKRELHQLVRGHETLPVVVLANKQLHGPLMLTAKMEHWSGSTCVHLYSLERTLTSMYVN
ncbi:ADP-ribosylation factor-like protein 9 isoform X2 [Stegostoma tigrinum]|uniref:ADP-ribosylation factor-like protein 9 isoform X2 n=1 Tax=Stegostoma tigrinum TaxID=3053191 RepID=UPI00202B722D|nr:ADP-ribosylation factor-like protein 9 isoform X2 [Stegostoma tigrinum]